MSDNKKDLNNYDFCMKDSQFYNENRKIMQHVGNGLSRFLILWIIHYHKNIHGYAIMKELDKFFENIIEEGYLKKSSSSKIYPILNKMEESNLIIGNWEINDNKKVKYYKITEKGELLLKHIKSRHVNFMKNSQWKLLYDDFHRANF